MEYVAQAVQQHDMCFEVTAGSHTSTTDYPLEAGDPGAGPRPLELLLGSLASCAGGSLVALLRRAGQSVSGLTVTARGERRAEHPTVFTAMALEFVVRGPVDHAAVAKAIAVSESTICPVWAMLKPGTTITASFRIEK
ncbi:MAG: OsmC family protein [Vicinamibacterales bacterium]